MYQKRVMPFILQLFIHIYPPCVFLVQTGDRVGIIRLPEFNGSLVIYVNGAPIGIIATGVAENVYGFVEMQEDCEKVCMQGNRSVQNVS